jgi:hypothetical protein
MFTCSSCGYEANPDSAPACSLCGTKKPGAGGSAIRSAPKPAGDDELANAAKAVAESAEPAAPARASSKGAKPAASKGGAIAIQSSTGVLRRTEEAHDLANSSTALGVFAGLVLGYIASWVQAGHAPTATGGELWQPFVGALILGTLGRLWLATLLEINLDSRGRERFQGPISAAVGLGFFVFTIAAFFLGYRATSSMVPPEASAAAAVGAEGRSVAEHLVFLTPWNLKVKTDKHVTLVRDGKTVEIPVGKLTAENVRDVQKALGMPASEFERYVADEPLSGRATLPDNFSLDRFLDQLGPALGVQKDTTSKPTPGKILLTHRRSNGQDEALWIPEKPVFAGDLQTALPKGVKLWIAISLGLPPHANTTPEHDQFVSEVIDKYQPTN